MEKINTVFDNLKTLADALQPKQTVQSLKEHMEILLTSVKVLADHVVKLSNEKESSEKSAREMEDEVDDYKQKNLAGKYVITCDRKKASEVKTQEELAADGGDRALPAHIVQLVQSKYGVVIREDDISSCHYLPKGSIFFSLWNQRPGSPSSTLTDAIKTSKDKTKNVFINFMMTRRRSSLLFEVRKLKKQNKIARYYSDEKGIITIKVKEGDTNIKLCSFYQTKNSPVKTYTVAEMKRKVAELQPQQQQK